MSKSKASSATQTMPPAVHNKGTGKRRRGDMPMVQNVLLIWLDGKINKSNSDYRNTISHLPRSVNTINTFVNSQERIQFLEDIEDEKTCMIISGALGQQIVPRVHNLFQVDSIFIFCNNKEYHQGCLY